MLRFFFLSLFVAVIAVVAIAGFRGDKSTKAPIVIFPDMDVQPRFDPQHPSGFYSDGRAARHGVDGTVPQGYVQNGLFSATEANNARHLNGPAAFTNETDYVETGRIGNFWGNGIPLEPSVALLERGKQRYEINCAVCHGPTGDGTGVVGKYGMGGIANLLSNAFQTMPDGNIFDTITHGKGNMGPYGANITIEDRWAIVAYIRALQRSQNAKLDDLTAEQRKDLEKQ